MISMQRKNFDCAEGDVPADAWITAIIKIGCILFIGLVIVGGITTAGNITASSPFYSMYQSVTSNFESGYVLASLMVLVFGAAGIMHFLGFM